MGLMLVAVLFNSPSFSQEAENNSQVIQAFSATEHPQGEHVTVSDREKRQVMFFLGVPLLVFILIAGGLGIAMGIYGKPVFVAHMIFAGLSITLAVAHAIVGLVWFYPF
jgi:hypothetical protein